MSKQKREIQEKTKFCNELGGKIAVRQNVMSPFMGFFENVMSPFMGFFENVMSPFMG